MATKNYSLLMQLGPAQGEMVPLAGSEFLIGRDPSSDWVIDDVEVSRRHARLIPQSGGYAIEDLGSTNGTFVNGQRIRTVLPLLPGATIRLGENVLLFYDLAPKPEGAQASQTLQFDTRPKHSAQAEEAPKEEAPRVEMLETFERREPEPAPASQTAPPTAAPASAPKAVAPDAAGLPFYRRPIVMLIGAVAILGLCGLTAFLWYVDANYLWCDVFGNLISACAVP
jgi:hypothetical protein